MVMYSCDWSIIMVTTVAMWQLMTCYCSRGNVTTHNGHLFDSKQSESMLAYYNVNFNFPFKLGPKVGAHITHEFILYSRFYSIFKHAHTFSHTQYMYITGSGNHQYTVSQKQRHMIFDHNVDSNVEQFLNFFQWQISTKLSRYTVKGNCEKYTVNSLCIDSLWSKVKCRVLLTGSVVNVHVPAADLSVPFHASRVELLDVCLQLSQRALPGVDPSSVCCVPSTQIHTLHTSLECKQNLHPPTASSSCIMSS